MLEQIIIPVITAVLGFLAANWKTLITWNRDNDNELVKAVKEAREDILRLYKIIDEMEKINVTIKEENLALKAEVDQFRQLAEQAKSRLADLQKYVAELEEKVCPQSKRKKNEDFKISRV